MATFHWPNNSQRLLEIGRTGSGKTTASLYILAMKNWEKTPWVIFDTKGDPDIAKLGRMDGTKIIKLNDKIGANGLYIVRPLPNESDESDEFLWNIWQRGNVGVYFDEGYMLDRSEALNAILTQGRTKRIPVILCSQRPAWLTRFAFSESDFFQVFNLTDMEDRKRVQQFIPKRQADLEERLPPYHSLWYDVKQDQVTRLAPTPPSEAILGTFRERLMPRRVAI